MEQNKQKVNGWEDQLVNFVAGNEQNLQLARQRKEMKEVERKDKFKQALNHQDQRKQLRQTILDNIMSRRHDVDRVKFFAAFTVLRKAFKRVLTDFQAKKDNIVYLEKVFYIAMRLHIKGKTLIGRRGKERNERHRVIFKNALRSAMTLGVTDGAESRAAETMEQFLEAFKPISFLKK